MASIVTENAGAAVPVAVDKAAAQPSAGKRRWGPMKLVRKWLHRDRPATRRSATPQPEWPPEPALGLAPRFSLNETRDGFTVVGDVPGLKEADLEIEVVSHRLTVRGERARESEQRGERVYLRERRYGSFARTFTLPREADLDRASASLARGVLTITVPKAAEAKGKTIAVKLG